MIEQLKNIWQRRELLYYIVKHRMQAENKNKVLGFLWSFLNSFLPLVTCITLAEFLASSSIKSCFKRSIMAKCYNHPRTRSFFPLFLVYNKSPLRNCQAADTAIP